MTALILTHARYERVKIRLSQRQDAEAKRRCETRRIRAISQSGPELRSLDPASVAGSGSAPAWPCLRARILPAASNLLRRRRAAFGTGGWFCARPVAAWHTLMVPAPSFIYLQWACNGLGRSVRAVRCGNVCHPGLSCQAAAVCSSHLHWLEEEAVAHIIPLSKTSSS